MKASKNTKKKSVAVWADVRNPPIILVIGMKRTGKSVAARAMAAWMDSAFGGSIVCDFNSADPNAVQAIIDLTSTIGKLSMLRPPIVIVSQCSPHRFEALMPLVTHLVCFKTVDLPAKAFPKVPMTVWKRVLALPKYHALIVSPKNAFPVQEKTDLSKPEAFRDP